MATLKNIMNEAISDILLIASINKHAKAKQLIYNQFYVISKEDVFEFINILTNQVVFKENDELKKQNVEWKEECERLASIADFWQNKYSTTQPPPIRGIDNL